MDSGLVLMFLTIMFIIGVIALCIAYNKETAKNFDVADYRSTIWLTVVVTSIGIFMITEILCVVLPDQPKAIDVYREKTELVIDESYRNGECVSKDSTVIFKGALK